MQDISRTGRTVVLVSHNMTVVNQLCDKAVWLDHGTVRQIGPAERVISKYLADGRASSLEWRPPLVSDTFVIERVAIEQPGGDGTFRFDEDIPFTFDAVVKETAPPTHVSLNVVAEDGTLIFVSVSSDGQPQKNQPFTPGRYRLGCTIPGNLLKPGRYIINVWLPAGQTHLPFESILSFVVSEQNCRVHGARHGFVAPLLRWSVAALETNVVEATSPDVAR